MAMNEKLKEYRDRDIGNYEMTLHPDRLRAYLEKNSITAENFDEKFKIAQALEITKQGHAPGDKKMYADLKDATDFVENNKNPHLSDIDWEETNRATFNSTLKKDLANLFNNDNERTRHELIIMNAYRVYHEAIRKVAQASLEIRKDFEEQRGEHKDTVEGNIWDKVKGGFKDVFGKLGKNWEKSTSGEKAVYVGALIGIGAFLSFSQNETLKKIRGAVWTGLKWTAVGGGVIIGANYLTKLFTGETAANQLSDWNNATVGNPDMWKETFDTDHEGAEKLQHSVVALGQMKFSTLADKYKGASGKKIELGSKVHKQMSPEDVYTALDIFFKKYPVDSLKNKYKNSKVQPTWLDVVTNELAESGKLEPSENVFSAAGDKMEEGVTRGWNWFMTGAAYPGWNMMKRSYRYVFGKEGSDGDIKAYAQQKLPEFIKESKNSDAEIPAFLDEKFGSNSASANGYKQALKEMPDPNAQTIRFKEVANDSIYMVSEINLGTRSMEEREKIMTEAATNAYEFLKKKYPTENADNISKMILLQAGTFVAQPPKFQLFVRKPLQGSAEWVSYFGETPIVRDEKPGVDIFNEKSELVYDKLEDYEREILRLRFLLSSEQSGKLQEICDWYKVTYKDMGKSKKDVMEALLNGSDEERDKALTAKGLMVQGGRKLLGGYDLLKGLNGEDAKLVNDIEKPAAQKARNADAYARLQEFMKRSKGYKLRLAIAGDPEARAHFKSLGRDYDFETNSKWLENSKAEYKKKCDKLVEDYNAGRLTLPG